MKKILILLLLSIGTGAFAQEYESVKNEIKTVYLEYTGIQPGGGTVKDVYVISPKDKMTLHKELDSKGYEQKYNDGQIYVKNGYIIDLMPTPSKFRSRYETEERYVIYITIYKDSGY